LTTVITTAGEVATPSSAAAAAVTGWMPNTVIAR
jgi:hypothetical protein